MTLLIDGYNLLNAVGITGHGTRQPAFGHVTSLERSRNALLNFLAESLAPGDLAGTTVVFDAQHAPPGLPRLVEHCGMAVRFAPRHEEADALIEELIEAESAPRRLTVVSSDHRLRRAARRRKARAVDSDVWFHELLTARSQRQVEPAPPAQAQRPLSEAEIARWLEEFGGREALEALAAAESVSSGDQSSGHSPGQPAPPPDKLTSDQAADIGNPFPPGYAEDLAEELRGDQPAHE